MAGGMKSGLESLEDAKQDEMMFMELALRVRMRHEFDQELGAVHFSLSYREKVIVMSFSTSGEPRAACLRRAWPRLYPYPV